MAGKIQIASNYADGCGRRPSSDAGASFRSHDSGSGSSSSCRLIVVKSIMQMGALRGVLSLHSPRFGQRLSILRLHVQLEIGEWIVEENAHDASCRKGRAVAVSMALYATRNLISTPKRPLRCASRSQPFEEQLALCKVFQSISCGKFEAAPLEVVWPTVR